MDEQPAAAVAIAGLRAEWGLDARVVERIVACLHPPGRTVGELVRAATAPRRDVEQVLERLEPWLVVDGDRFALPAGDLDTAPGWLFPAPVTDPVERALAATMAPIAAGLPPSVWSLDHVPATPATMAARALFLTRAYALDGRRLLCVGDHDLTSVAVALAEPAVEVLVVDVDQRLLAYLNAVAAERGLPITTAFADLRLGLPAGFAGRADLAFTDPPYSPEGVGLFTARALAGLRRTGHERVAVAYGFSPHQPARGFRTQSALHELRLVLEAVLPRFNRFDGAEAIGAAADLYVARPTRWTWPVLDRAGGVDPRIYTRGAAAAESAPSAVDPAVVAAVDAVVPGPDRLLVGDGWPADAPGRRVPLGSYLDGARGPAAVNLDPHHGATLPAVLLAAAAREVTAVLAPGRDLAGWGPVRRLVAPVLTVSVDGGLVVARRRPSTREGAGTGTPGPAAGDGGPAAGAAGAARAAGPAGSAPPAGSDEDAVLAWLVTHPAATVGNAWREALLEVARRHGGTLTKNQARAAIRESGVPAGALALRLADLPRDTVERLLAAVPATVRAATG